MPADLIVVLLALAAALLFAVGTQFLHLGMKHGDPQTGTLIDIATCAAIFWLTAPLALKVSYWFTAAALIFAVLGIFRPVLSSNLAARGVHYLGPTLTSALASTTPLFGACFGVLLLGEALTWPIALGTAAIIAALLLQAGRGRRAASWPVWALALPLGASFLRSASHAFTKIGLEEVASPHFVALVGYSVSLTVALAAQRARRLPLPAFRARPGLAWFAAAGLVHAAAVFSMTNALALGQLVVVVPLISAYPVFTLALSWAVFRRERLGWRTVTAVALVVPGVTLIALAR